MDDDEKLEAIRNAEPGTRITFTRFRVDIPDKVLDRRKDDDSGWWLTDGSGLDDTAFVEDWEFVD
jgi:hypothetical protein